MLIRPLTRADIPSVALITHSTFSKDELFMWIYPHQAKYPDDLRRFQLIRLRTRLVEKGSHGFVSETEPSDAEWSGTPEITGLAFYIRSGTDSKAEKWLQDSLARKLERYLLEWEKWYETRILDRASDASNLATLQKATEYEFYASLNDYWHLGLLAVDPKFQRRGIGAQLVAYGQKMAQEEEVPVTLQASVLGRFLYTKMGFRVVEENAIVEGLEGVAMLWEPEGLEGKWLEDVGEGTGKGKAKVKDV